jgi:CHAT domain-containing protein/Tfp pilus assembly protein PilF
MALQVEAGQFLGIVVEQEGIDLVVELRDPDGKTVVEMDGPDYWWWEEEVAWMAERSGVHEVVVRALLPDAAPGTYRLRMDGPRAPRPEDRARLQATVAMREAHALILQPGKDAERLGHLETALPLWRGLGERRREAEVLHQMGGRLFELHRHQESAERFHQAVAIWEALGLPDRRAWSLLAAGHIDQILLREKESLGHLEEGLAFARQAGLRDLEVQALYLLGRFHENNSPRTAVDYLKSALQLARDLRNELVEMRALHYLGYLYGDLAEPQEALRSYEDALPLASRLQQSRLEAVTLNNMGLLYDDLGDTERAIRFYEQALAIRGTLESFHATVLNNQARAQERSAPARARELYERSLALCEKIGDRKLQATALNNLALLDLSMGDAPGSLRRSRQALELAATVNPDVEIDVRRALGMAHRQLGDLESSRCELEAALALSRERQDRVRESQIIPMLARTERSAGDPRQALELLEQGVEILETIRAKVVEVDLRTAFLASRQDIYELRTNTLMALHRAHPGQGYDARALRANEQARARGLIDMLAEAGADDDDMGGMGGSETLSVDEIRRQVLDGRALLLEYALGQEGSFLWAVGPDSLRSFDLPPRKVIEKTARRWYDALKSNSSAPDAANELSAMLLGPVEGLLTGQPLLIVADGALQYLPFGALPLKRALLIDRHEVTSLPSASALAVLRREIAGRAKAPKLLAMLADPVFGPQDTRVAAANTRGGEIDPRKLPRLRFSRDEAEAIAGLVPEPQRYMALGFAASRSAVVSGELANYQMVHIAAHGLIDSRRPELSTIVLSLVDERGEPQNGFLRLHDIYNLELQADLVALSACETALGQEIRGEGLVGLTRGFMYAGAARVLASLWSVDDRATSVLMKSFYGHMFSGGLSPAAALRQAQSEMAHGSRWSSPYYWAGFSLQGEWQ